MGADEELAHQACTPGDHVVEEVAAQGSHLSRRLSHQLDDVFQGNAARVDAVLRRHHRLPGGDLGQVRILQGASKEWEAAAGGALAAGVDHGALVCVADSGLKHGAQVFGVGGAELQAVVAGRRKWVAREDAHAQVEAVVLGAALLLAVLCGRGAVLRHLQADVAVAQAPKAPRVLRHHGGRRGRCAVDELQGDWFDGHLSSLAGGSVPDYARSHCKSEGRNKPFTDVSVRSRHPTPKAGDGRRCALITEVSGSSVAEKHL